MMVSYLSEEFMLEMIFSRQSFLSAGQALLAGLDVPLQLAWLLFCWLDTWETSSGVTGMGMRTRGRCRQRKTRNINCIII